MFTKITLMITVAAVLGLSGSFVQGALAQQGLIAHDFDAARTPPTFNVRFEAPGRHRQPSIAEIEQGQSFNGSRSPAEINGGYGLNLVNALASAWGAEPSAQGKSVWAAVGRDLDL